MGKTTLEEYRTRMGVALGNRGDLSPDLLKIWLNSGQNELAGAVLFEDLKCRTTTTLPAETIALGFPNDALAIIALSDETNDRTLTRTVPERYHSMEREVGELDLWYTFNRKIEVWRAPEKNTTISITYYREPAKLESDEDVSALPSTWDEGIYLFAMHNAHIDLGEDERAAFWFSRAIAHVRSRMTDEDFNNESDKEGVRIIDGSNESLTQRGTSWR